MPDVLLQGVSSSHTSAAEDLDSWKMMWVSHKQNIKQKAIFLYDAKYLFLIQQEGTNALHVACDKFAFTLFTTSLPSFLADCSHSSCNQR